MDPWDEFAAKFGEAEATKRLGPKPVSAPAPASREEQVLGPAVPWREQRDSVSARLRGPIRAAGQGVFGMGDEARSVVAGIGALVPGGRSPGQAFRETMASEKSAQDEWSSQNKTANVAAQLGAGLASGGAVVRGGARLLGRVAPAAAQAIPRLTGPGKQIRNAAVAGGAGAATTFGLASGSPEERLEATPAGFGWGAGAALAFPAAAKAGGIVADALDIRSQEGVRGRAREILLDWLKKDETTIEGVAQRVGKLRGPMTVAEGAGPNTRRLVGTIESKPGPGSTRVREQFTARQGQAPARIDADIRGQVGANVGDLEGVMTARSQSQRAEGDLTYGAAKAQGDIQSPELAALLASDRPAVQAAISMVQKNYANAGKQMPPLDGPLPLQVVDDIKGAVDHIAKWGSDGATRQARSSENAVRGITGEIFDIVDPINPLYPKARGAWSAAEGAKEAFDEGYKTFSKMEPEAVARRMQEPGAEDFRLGVARFLRETGGGAAERSGSHNLPAKIMGSGERELWAPGSEQKIRAVFGDKADEFLRGMESEGAIHSTFGQMAGSRTAPLAEASTALEKGMGVAEDMGRVGRGDLGGVVGLLRAATQSRAAGFNQRTMAELADMLTAGVKDPSDLQKLLEELRQAEAARASGAPAARAGIAAGLAGGL